MSVRDDHVLNPDECPLCESPILDYEPGKTTIEKDGVSYHRSCYENEEERQGVSTMERSFTRYWEGRLTIDDLERENPWFNEYGDFTP